MSQFEREQSLGISMRDRARELFVFAREIAASENKAGLVGVVLFGGLGGVAISSQIETEPAYGIGENQATASSSRYPELSKYPKSGVWNVCNSDTQDVIHMLDPNNPSSREIPLPPTGTTGSVGSSDEIITDPNCEPRWGFDWTGESSKQKNCRDIATSNWTAKTSKLRGDKLTSTIDITGVQTCNNIGKREFRVWPAVINPNTNTATKIGRQLVFKTNKAMGDYGKFSGGSTKRKEINLRIDERKVDCSNGKPEILTIVRTTLITKSGPDNNQVYAIPVKGECK